ncbi:polysaccharide biosynthesis/export family protein [Thetidibacter halocola]|uniref:polysaccharide biosynthesis/export family protein n=1 Tax=Thetidibacter halocola TaxID=2827239 RepID=UPI0031FEDF52
MTSIYRRTAILLIALSVSACSLPRGAALQSEILKEPDQQNPTFQVVEVTRASLPGIARWAATGQQAHFHWPNTSDGANANFIRTGDRLDVTIWDSQENSLITAPDERFTKIENIEVEADGSVFLPYVNRVRVRDLTVSRARERIEEQLTSIVPSAQVQLSLREGRDNAVDMVSGVAKPGAYPFPNRNYKILSALADAGGIPSDLRNPRIRLLRGSATYTISADALYESGAMNALLQPRDQVIVEEDDRKFIALGASGKEDLIYFPTDELSALEALALMNGLSDSRADPKGVLVLREYSGKQLRQDGSGPSMPQVVFALDLTSADGLFAARNFRIMPDDTVLATESAVNSARTIFGLIGSVVGLSNQVGNL